MAAASLSVALATSAVPIVLLVAIAAVVARGASTLMQCGPAWAWHTIVGGRFVVRDGLPVTVDLPTVLERHRAAALRVQRGA